MVLDRAVWIWEKNSLNVCRWLGLCFRHENRITFHILSEMQQVDKTIQARPWAGHYNERPFCVHTCIENRSGILGDLIHWSFYAVPTSRNIPHEEGWRLCASCRCRWGFCIRQYSWQKLQQRQSRYLLHRVCREGNSVGQHPLSIFLTFAQTRIWVIGFRHAKVYCMFVNIMTDQHVLLILINTSIVSLKSSPK